MSQYNNLPQELRETGRFNCWRYVQKPDKEKPDKVPFNPHTGGYGQSNNPATFADFQSALAVAESYDGMGIGVFGELVVVDIDECVRADGAISEMAQDIVDRLDSYTETSPSGTGLRIIIKAGGFKFDKERYYINNRKNGLEIYIAGATLKFLTVTGNVIRAKGVEVRSEQLQKVLETYMLRPTTIDISNVEAQSYLTDEEIICKAMKGKDGDVFSRLWDGDTSGFVSASEADMRFAGTAAEVERIVSALPPKQAAAVHGRFWENKTLTEVGAGLGLSPKQMHNQYRDAIRKLRRDKRLQEIHDNYFAETTLTKHTGFQFFKENQMSSVEWHLIRLEERLERAKGGDNRDRMQ